jgi:Trk-type K+ transport system membrane component
MFVGRLGPLTLALALAARERRAYYRWPEESIRIG